MTEHQSMLILTPIMIGTLAFVIWKSQVHWRGLSKEEREEAIRRDQADPL